VWQLSVSSHSIYLQRSQREPEVCSLQRKRRSRSEHLSPRYVFRMCQSAWKEKTRTVVIQTSESYPYLTTLLVQKITFSVKKRSMTHELSCNWCSAAGKALPVCVDSSTELQGQSQNNTASVWGSKEQDFSKPSALAELLTLHVGSSPRRRCNNKANSMFGITGKNADKKWQWTQRCYTYNKHSAWMNGKDQFQKWVQHPNSYKKNVDCTVSEPSWQTKIQYILSRICVSSLQCLGTCANWYHGAVQVTISSHAYPQQTCFWFSLMI